MADFSTPAVSVTEGVFEAVPAVVAGCLAGSAETVTAAESTPLAASVTVITVGVAVVTAAVGVVVVEAGEPVLEETAPPIAATYTRPDGWMAMARISGRLES